MRIDYSPFFRSTVGFDRLLGLLESASEQGYPPYNIERGDENNYRVTLAVAGFAEKDLSVDVKDRVLTVSGSPWFHDQPVSACHRPLLDPAHAGALLEGPSRPQGQQGPAPDARKSKSPLPTPLMTTKHLVVPAEVTCSVILLGGKRRA